MSFYHNKNVSNHNADMMNQLPSNILSTNAMHAHPKGTKPFINPSKGTIGNTDFLDKFEFKIGAKCMMIYKNNVSLLILMGIL